MGPWIKLDVFCQIVIKGFEKKKIAKTLLGVPVLLSIQRGRD